MIWPIEGALAFSPQHELVRIRWKPTRMPASALGRAIHRPELWPGGMPADLAGPPKAMSRVAMRRYEHEDDIAQFISAEYTPSSNKNMRIHVWVAWKDSDEPADGILTRYDLTCKSAWICGEVPMEFRLWFAARQSALATAMLGQLPPVAPVAAPKAEPAPMDVAAAAPPAKRRRVVEIAERAGFADLSAVERAADTIEALVACGALTYGAGDGGADGVATVTRASSEAGVQTLTAAHEVLTLEEANAHVAIAQQHAVAIALAHERASQAAHLYARNVLCQRIYEQLKKAPGVGAGGFGGAERAAAETLAAMQHVAATAVRA